MRTYALENRGRAPLYEYLYRCIRGDILDGTLTAGERLPSKRALAEHLLVGKIHIRIFFRHLCRSLHISPAGGEDDVASIVDTFLNGLSGRLGIAVVDIDLTYDLII